MTGRAIVGEHRLAAGLRQRKQRRIVLDLNEGGAGEHLHLVAAYRLEIGELDGNAGARRIMKETCRISTHQRPGGIHHPVSYRPKDGRIEAQHPPARQRRIELLDAVPLVAGGRAAGYMIDVVAIGHHSSPRAAAFWPRYRMSSGYGDAAHKPRWQ